MSTLEIDRESLALAKQIHAKVRADAEGELKKRMQSMSNTERAKLTRMLTNIEFLGDVGKAAATSRVSRKLLDKWLNTPGVSWQINIAFNEAQALLHCGRTADDILWRAKIEPELIKDAEVFQATGQRNRESKVIVKLVARDLKAHRWQIVQAANNGDNHFFIDLGRILSGDASAELYDKLDADIAELWCQDPTISAGKAVTDLEQLGHTITEDGFRVRKRRLGLSKPQERKK